MFPIRDNVRRRHLPVVTWLLILLQLAVFGYELALPAARLEELFQLAGLVPRRYADPAWAAAVGFPARDYWPFLTSMFLHGGLFHVLANTWMLWIFGDNVEDRLGPPRFLVFFTTCGLVAALVQLAADTQSAAPMIGASGAVAGVMGAYFVLFPRARVVCVIPILCWPLFLEVPALLFLGFWFVIQFYGGALAMSDAPELGGVAWWAHVGGFLSGILLLALLDRPRGRPESPTSPWSAE